MSDDLLEPLMSALEPMSQPAYDAGEQVVSLVKPVSLTMILVVLLIDQLGDSTRQLSGGFSQLMVYHEDASDSAGTVLAGVLLNGAGVAAGLAGVTSALFLLYRHRCYALIYGWLLLSVSGLLFAFGGFVAQQLFELHDLPVDGVSFYLVLWNFSCVGTLLVFWAEAGCGERPPLALQQRMSYAGTRALLRTLSCNAYL